MIIISKIYLNECKFHEVLVKQAITHDITNSLTTFINNIHQLVIIDWENIDN